MGSSKVQNPTCKDAVVVVAYKRNGIHEHTHVPRYPQEERQYACWNPGRGSTCGRVVAMHDNSGPPAFSRLMAANTHQLFTVQQREFLGPVFLPAYP
jgi:hypothetical protein